MLVANKLFFCGLPILWLPSMFLWVNLKKPQKTNLFATNLSYRLPIFKIISCMTNITTAVMLITFSMPRTTFFESKHFWSSVFSKIRRLCGPVTFVNDDIMASQWKKLQAKWPLRSSWFVLLVMRWNIREENPKRSVIVQKISNHAARWIKHTDERDQQFFFFFFFFYFFDFGIFLY